MMKLLINVPSAKEVKHVSLFESLSFLWLPCKIQIFFYFFCAIFFYLGKNISRSKSDTGLKKIGSSRITKVLWAVTRINVFQNNCKTYEIMDTTTTPPRSPPVKTEGIFVVKTSNKRKPYFNFNAGPF